MVSHIISLVSRQGYTPVLVTRGYGRKENKHRIISPEESTFYAEVGDEPLMLKRRHPSLWLAVGAHRSKNLRAMEEKKLHRPVYIMDDGFQHRQVARHLDIVTLPPNIRTDKLIPAGKMREPLHNISRATHCVCMNNEKRTRSCTPTQFLPTQKTPPQILSATITAHHWVHTRDGRKKTYIPGTVDLFSGIARPQRFKKSSLNKSGKIGKHIIFSDHHTYRKCDYKRINSLSAENIGTTEKDFIRLDLKKLDFRKNFWYLYTQVDTRELLSLDKAIIELCEETHE